MTCNRLVDPFGRHVDYLRVSVTDRCDLRCFYCMAENMKFLPKRDVLSLEELDRLCSLFIENGIKHIRLTGGEPLVRKNILSFIQSLSRHLQSGELKELTLTTNGSQLKRMANDLAACGIERINVSLDSLKPDRFAEITRLGHLHKVLDGIDAALAAGIKVKLNAVALRDINDDEYGNMIQYCHQRGMDLTLIETMPMGEIGHDRNNVYLPLSDVQRHLAETWTLSPSAHKTGGPATYFDVKETGGRIGFITPMSNCFCESCNRVRLSSTGTLYTCLGRNGGVELRPLLKGSEGNVALDHAIRDAIDRKPKGHNFVINRDTKRPTVNRFMSLTGG